MADLQKYKFALFFAPPQSAIGKFGTFEKCLFKRGKVLAKAIDCSLEERERE
jgi:hypothetical protein